MSNRKQKYIIIGALCLVVVGLSIGYAVLSASLKIGGTADVQGGSWEVKFLSERTVVDKKGLAVCEMGTIADTSITGLSARLKAPGDSCTFKVQAKNTGTLNAGLSEVENRGISLTFEGSGDNKEQDEELLKSEVTYEVYYGDTQINEKTVFDNIPILKPDDEETIILRVTYNSDATKLPEESVTVTGLDRTFIFDNLDERPTPSEGAPVNCKVPSYIDTSGANAPVLNGDMIPVVYSENCEKWVKQDLNKSYDYSKQVWANAVTVTSDVREEIKNAPVGTEIDMSKINTMWVWIPRYSYTIKSEDGGTNYYGKASFGNDNPSRELPGEIDVKFIKNGTEMGIAQYMSDEASGWRTNEAFNFSGANQAGMWVGKFETTGSLKTDNQACIDTSCDVSDVTIKPGIVPLQNQTVSSFFYMSRSMQLHNANTYGFNENSGDLHMMKNDEWGAVAYLSQSKYGKYGNINYIGENKEVYKNISETAGNSGGYSEANWEFGDQVYEYNDLTSLGTGMGQAGPGASTTGTIYGVYDMSGGFEEYVMGVLEYDAQGVEEHNGQIVTGSSSNYNSGFKGLNKNESPIGTYELPEDKYYNKYKSADKSTNDFAKTKPESACNNGICYGHALSEIYGDGGNYTWNGWYDDQSYFVYNESSWFRRGGYYMGFEEAGLFNTSPEAGSMNGSCRLVLTP